MTTSGNIEQRVYDVFIGFGPGVPVRLDDVYVSLPYLHRRSAREAITRLCKAGVLKPCNLTGIVYELAADAQRPNDGRGRPKGKVGA